MAAVLVLVELHDVEPTGQRLDFTSGQEGAFAGRPVVAVPEQVGLLQREVALQGRRRQVDAACRGQECTSNGFSSGDGEVRAVTCSDVPTPHAPGRQGRFVQSSPCAAVQTRAHLDIVLAAVVVQLHRTHLRTRGLTPPTRAQRPGIPTWW